MRKLQTPPEVFRKFIVDGRRDELAYVPRSEEKDADLVAQMVKAEYVLLGDNSCNRDVVELIRWVKRHPRPQCVPLPISSLPQFTLLVFFQIGLLLGTVHGHLRVSRFGHLGN